MTKVGIELQKTTVTNTRRSQECARMMFDLAQACIGWRKIPSENDVDCYGNADDDDLRFESTLLPTLPMLTGRGG